jgi:hypothetical protein
MSGADKLTRLHARCKAGVHLTINEHRNYYETAEDRIDKWYAGLECPPTIEPHARQQMIECDTIVDLIFYPDTPIGSYHVVSHDVGTALDEALEILAEQDGAAHG